MTLPFNLPVCSPQCVLVIEDDLGLMNMLKWRFKQKMPHIQFFGASSVDDASTMLSNIAPDVVILDLGLPPDPDNATEGLKILKAIYENKSKFPYTKVLAHSGTTRPEHAQECARYGAYFISKSGEHDTLFSFVDLLLNHSLLCKQNNSEHLDHEHSLLIGKSPALLSAIRKAEKVAKTDISVLILGESGTGKEVFAKLLHDKSGRTGAFVALNCAAIPEDLLENELFGHEKGAFTGASTLKKGKVEQAHGGTLFLDEIGDMPLQLQSKILRFLQEGSVDRVGGSSSIPVDVRVVCATHRDLKSMIDKSCFRSDLFYRLAKMTIELPALRERDNDALELANYFLKDMCNKYPSFNVSGFSDSAEQAILDYHWPGNIRELQNKIQSAVINADNNLITATNLELAVKGGFLCQAVIDSPVDPESCELGDLNLLVTMFEHQLIGRALENNNNNVSQAAKQLKIRRTTLYAKIKHHKKIFNKPDCLEEEPSMN